MQLATVSQDFKLLSWPVYGFLFLCVCFGWDLCRCVLYVSLNVRVKCECRKLVCWFPLHVIFILVRFGLVKSLPLVSNSNKRNNQIDIYDGFFFLLRVTHPRSMTWGRVCFGKSSTKKIIFHVFSLFEEGEKPSLTICFFFQASNRLIRTS